MANTSRPSGFIPSRTLSGADWNGQFTTYYIPSTDANQMNVGDAVKTAAVSDANGMMGCTKITNGTDTIRGIIVGFQVAGGGTSFQGTNLDLTLQNIPATKTRAYYAFVVDDPAMLFEIEDDGAATPDATYVNKNASFTVTNPTSPAQNSATVLSLASVNTTQALNLRIMGLVQRDNNELAVRAKWLVKINQHELMGNTAGI